MKLNIKTNIILCICALLVLFLAGLKRRNDREKLMKTGAVTVGIITHTHTHNGRLNDDPYVIDFSFIKDDTIINGITSLTLEEKDLFFKAIVGQTYKVRYNPNKPKKSRIYPDEPVMVSNEDYERLLDRVYIRQQQVEKSKTWWKNF